MQNNTIVIFIFFCYEAGSLLRASLQSNVNIVKMFSTEP